MEGNTTNSTERPCGFSEMPARTFFICVYTLICSASLVLNSVTIYVYFCKVTHKSSITVYLKNLAVADLFVCLCLILRIIKYAVSSEEIHRIYCNFGAPASYLNMYSSILFMGYIAVNRYLKIVRPMEAHIMQTIRSTRNICIATWAILLTVNCFYMVAFASTQGAGTRSPAEGDFDCGSYHNSLLKTIYMVMQITSFVMFLFVLVSFMLLYWWTVQRLRQAERAAPAQTSSTKLIKSKRNMKVLVGVFCLCFVPYHLIRLPYVFIKPLLHDCMKAQTFYILKELTVMLAMLNASLDPIIYFVFCKAFRAHIRLRQR
ncbi:G-protein coupled receptor 87-like [Misgurnus anguillicaudatus]|uniref:G-protein coupled receptor 87-like n=1 Tax=Misgurnus anguillicaudatus TaxID=75329 RepID=UPI003CCFAED7